MNYFYFESFLVTYNTGIYICIYIYKVTYIFVIFNCNNFSALRAKHFEIWKNILWNWWVVCFIAPSIKWCDHIFQLSRYERETPDFRVRLPPSRQFWKSPAFEKYSLKIWKVTNVNKIGVPNAFEQFSVVQNLFKRLVC